jgi:nucleoside-diphosphate-sugar epimerase
VASGPDSPIVLVTGATGAVGPALVERLLSAGYRVRVFSRHPEREAWSDRVTVHRGDLLDSTAMKAAVSHVEAVFHLAALLHVVNPSAALRAEYDRVNVCGTRAVVDASIAAGVKRIVLFSSIAVYGSTHGEIVDETSVPRPDSYYASSKLAAEAIVLAQKSSDDTPLGTVLRLAAVYGPRLKGHYAQLVRALSRHRFVPLGQGANRRTLVFDSDVANAAVAVLRSSAAAGRTYNVTDSAFNTMWDINGAICDALERKPPRLHLPAAPAKTAAAALESAARAIGVRSPIGRATIEKYLEDVAVRGSRITAEVGWAPRVDLRTGWVQTVRGMTRVGRRR